MTNKPSRWQRFFFRLPLWFYRWHLGWILGGRFLLLNHIGRKSNLPRQTVLEVVHHQADPLCYWVASGFGKKADWYRNLQATPSVTIQVGQKKWQTTAVFLSDTESGQMMRQYAQQNPKAAQAICRFLGADSKLTLDEYQTMGETKIPFVRFCTQDKTK